jgi:uncharacterized LabA/DUF88 family protein
MKLAVFIDYDNLLPGHKASGILDVTTKSVLRTPIPIHAAKGTCDVRIYGGWYEGTAMTQLAQDVAVGIQKEFPNILRVPSISSKNIFLTATAELAVAMMEEPGHHMLDTYRKRQKAGSVKVERPIDVGCTESGCPLPLAKKLIKTGMCPISTCTVAKGSLVYRQEQKIVDTMLACDMIYASKLGYDRIIVVSGDDDFLPPIRTVLRYGTPVSRFHPLPNRTRIPIAGFEKQLLEGDL